MHNKHITLSSCAQQKNTSPPTILEMYVSLPALTETFLEVNALGEFAPDRSVCSVGEGIEGGGMYLLLLPTSYSRDLIEYMTADACNKEKLET